MNAVHIQQLRNDLAGDVLNRPMRSINAEFSAFRSVEQGLLRGRQSEAGAHAAFLTTLAFLLALTAPAVGAAGLYVLVRERNRLRDRELQIQFEHSQRLSLMGETASMLAHEISQPLAAAKNYLSVLKHGFAASVTAPQAEIAQKVDDQLVRASGILQRLRNFIEKRTDEREAESPATLVADAVALLGTMHNQCALHTDIEKDLPKVLVDRVQIQQVLVNLMRNAIEAMANAACQELWLSVARAPNNMTLFQLRDCGPGISPQVRDRLFQPFASTKQGGMGVGLSICKRIIQDHGGEIRADTAPRGGAVFCFTLPVA
ncbi:MAG: GHKL domain-containing protein [Bradyrhizobium sp.]|nr:GHKL domain-containing protein [Bradyrhizobium sp.]